MVKPAILEAFGPEEITMVSVWVIVSDPRLLLDDVLDVGGYFPR
jgi:hypothetical protein